MPMTTFVPAIVCEQVYLQLTCTGWANLWGLLDRTNLIKALSHYYYLQVRVSNLSLDGPIYNL